MPAVIRRSEMEKLSYLMDQYSKLQANEIDRYQFVKAIGYRFKIYLKTLRHIYKCNKRSFFK